MISFFGGISDLPLLFIGIMLRGPDDELTFELRPLDYHEFDLLSSLDRDGLERASIQPRFLLHRDPFDEYDKASSCSHFWCSRFE